MANVLYMCPDYRFEEKGNLFVDLIDTFTIHGHNVTVMTPLERRYKTKTNIKNYRGLKVLHFKCLNFRGKVNVVEKGMATLLQGYQYLHAWKKYLIGEHYDIVICATLPITYSPALRYFKKKMRVFTYLQQKDFFPQSAVDLGLMKKNSVIYKIFRHLEKVLFLSSDKIGVISEKNRQYILENNPFLDKRRVEVCPNGKIPVDQETIEKLKANRKDIRKKYGIPNDKVLFLYGGNISRAQGIDFIKETITRIVYENINGGYFLFVGRGNEFEELQNHINRLNVNNVQIIKYIIKSDYDYLLASADVGMVFLDNRFTIANIPSRTLSHIDLGQPIIAATDGFTDYKDIIEDNGFGLWCQSNDCDSIIQNIQRMICDHELREKCGNNSRKYMLNECTAEIPYEKIINAYYSSQGFSVDFNE